MGAWRACRGESGERAIGARGRACVARSGVMDAEGGAHRVL